MKDTRALRAARRIMAQARASVAEVRAMAELRAKSSPDMLDRLAWTESALKLVGVEVLLSGPGVDAAAASRSPDAGGLVQNGPAAAEPPKKSSRQRSAA